jgi:hypothetical protein
VVVGNPDCLFICDCNNKRVGRLCTEEREDAAMSILKTNSRKKYCETGLRGSQYRAVRFEDGRVAGGCGA